jgi:CP12 domain
MTNSQEITMTIEERIEQARESAHQAGEKFGKTSPEFAVAMEILEELHQESGHQRSAKPQNSLERFCDDNPESPECLLYDS